MHGLKMSKVIKLKKKKKSELCIYKFIDLKDYTS